MQIQSFINASLQSSSTTFNKKDPFNNEILYQAQSCDLMQAVQAIQGAQKAFTEWKDVTFQQRVDLLKKIQNIIIQKKDEFAKLEALDQGLPFNFVRDHGLAACSDSLQNAISELEIHKNSDDAFLSPVGVITIISSWNLSLRVIFERLSPALAAGNAVVVKVSSQSPVTAFILAEILVAADVPSGLVQVLITKDQQVKDLLVTHPAIKGVSFIGTLKNSAEVLKKVSALSFNQFKKIQIATGSKNTAIALDDPTDSVFERIMDSFLIGQGQLAWNSNRFFILEKHENLWSEKIQNFLSQLKPAIDINDSSKWGPCLREESFAQFSEIENLALADQAKLIQSDYQLSAAQKKSFLKPAFTKDMSNCSTLQQDQVMAPLFILSVVKYPFDIAKYSNVSYYGQSASIWAEDSKIPKIAQQLDVAQINKSKWSVEVHKPLVGVKQSGFGLQDYRVFGDFFSNVKKMT